MNEETTPDLKALTAENLNAAGACYAGMSWITPFIEAEDPQVCEKLYTHNRDWFQWAIANEFDVYSRLSEEFLRANDMLPVATSGYRANASTSGYRANASTSGRASFAFARGVDSRVRGMDTGCCLIAAYYDAEFTKAHVATGTVGEDGIEANVWYSADAETGKLVKAADQSEPDWENEEN